MHWKPLGLIEAEFLESAAWYILLTSLHLNELVCDTSVNTFIQYQRHIQGQGMLEFWHLLKDWFQLHRKLQGDICMQIPLPPQKHTTAKY